MFSIDAPKWRMLILFAVSLISVLIAYRPILKIAKLKDIVDNPGARKLQKHPVPMLGGVAVFFGIIIGIGFFKTMVTYTAVFPIITAMVAMLYIGVTDDILGIAPWKRIVFEIAAALLIIYGNRYYISNFGGLFGIENIPLVLGIILSCITFVGVVNAINMIDGVDGLCSGISIMICLFFGLVFFFAMDYSFAALAAVTCGAQIPFFIHNVFGKKSKMFFGDGGSMVMGTVISAMIFELLSTKFGPALVEHSSSDYFPLEVLDFNLVAFALAVMSIPVFDTLRVMAVRILDRKSPFTADNNHLHHHFLRAGYSHIAVTRIEITLSLFVIMSMLLCWLLGASANVQLLVTILAASLADFATVYVLKHLAARHNRIFNFIAQMSMKSHFEKKGVWLKIQKIVDGDIINFEKKLKQSN